MWTKISKNVDEKMLIIFSKIIDNISENVNEKLLATFEKMFAII
jgi:hypothetical protein